MKIGFLLQSGAPDIRKPPFSGPSNHVRNICRELKQLGHFVRVIAFIDGQVWRTDDLETFDPVIDPYLDSRPINLVERGIRWVQSEFKLPYLSLFESLRFAWICCRELAGFDILIERMGWFGFGGWMAARRLNIPLVLEINGDHIKEMSQLGIAPQGIQRWISMFAMKNSIHGATAYIATGEGWRRCFAEQWGVNENRIAVIENGSEVIDLLYREQTRNFQAETSFDDCTHIVFIGSFDPWQGIDNLLEAFAQAVRQESNIHLSIIGSGVGLAEKTRWVQKHHLENYVSFLGWLPIGDIASYLATADIGVSPYCGRTEFSGLKLLDYKAAGLAIIASGQDGEPKVLKHGKTGWIVPPCDVSALRNAIIRLCRDKQLRKELGQAARIEAEQFHSWRITAKNVERVFLSVM